jgi:hypothetical protein
MPHQAAKAIKGMRDVFWRAASGVEEGKDKVILTHPRCQLSGTMSQFPYHPLYESIFINTVFVD